MSQLQAITTQPPPSAPMRQGRPFLAWLVILATVLFILWRYETVSTQEHERYDLVNMRLQGRFLVGMADRFMVGNKSGRQSLYEEAQNTLNRGTYAQRLRFVVLAGELKGPDEAREQLRLIDTKYRRRNGEPPAEEAETARILDRLYDIRSGDPKDAAFLPEDEQQELRHQLGWFGDLALAPPGGADETARAAVLAPAIRTMWAVLGAGIFMFVLGFAGLAFLITLIVLSFLDRLRSGLAPTSAHHGIYAETFAVYMLLFLGLSVGTRYAINWLSLEQGRLTLSGLAALGSLTALVWPVLRGIPWQQVQLDIGWHFDRLPGLELILGPGCYAMSLPMLVVGAMLYLTLTKLRDWLGFGPEEFGPSKSPGHPIVFWVSHARWWVWLEVLFVASFVAPLVEETMFRGVLYRHLREASRRWRPALSFFLSAILVSFLFAVIHPQGFLAVPMLMALAFAFTLMREWRGTLVPSMIAHGINNAVATLLLFSMS
jgi:membrane protease YdiL (CAAX protease family)